MFALVVYLALVAAILWLILSSTKGASDLRREWIRRTCIGERKTYHNRTSRPLAQFEATAAGKDPFPSSSKDFAVQAGPLANSSYRDAFLTPRFRGRIPQMSAGDAASEIIESRRMGNDLSAPSEKRLSTDPRRVARAVHDFWAGRNPASTEAMTHAAENPRVASIVVPKKEPKKKLATTTSTTSTSTTSTSTTSTTSTSSGFSIPAPPKLT